MAEKPGRKLLAPSLAGATLAAVAVAGCGDAPGPPVSAPAPPRVAAPAPPAVQAPAPPPATGMVQAPPPVGDSQILERPARGIDPGILEPPPSVPAPAR